MADYRIPVYQGNVVHLATVDEEWFAALSLFRWTFSGGYAVRNARAATDLHFDGGRAEGSIAMHRQVCGVRIGDPRVVHHVNEVKLDNRRGNLQVFASRAGHGRQPHSQWALDANTRNEDRPSARRRAA